jgi:hypothetical protein
MHRTIMLALGAGLLAVAALPFPGEALAAKKAGELDRATTKPATTAANCYQPPVLHLPAKTPMSALPPPRLCLGKQVQVKGTDPRHPVFLCVQCGLGEILVGNGCVSCKAGFTWRAASNTCCTGATKVPPPK